MIFDRRKDDSQKKYQNSVYSSLKRLEAPHSRDDMRTSYEYSHQFNFHCNQVSSYNYGYRLFDLYEMFPLGLHFGWKKKCMILRAYLLFKYRMVGTCVECLWTFVKMIAANIKHFHITILSNHLYSCRGVRGINGVEHILNIRTFQAVALLFICYGPMNRRNILLIGRNSCDVSVIVWFCRQRWFIFWHGHVFSHHLEEDFQQIYRFFLFFFFAPTDLNK